MVSGVERPLYFVSEGEMFLVLLFGLFGLLLSLLESGVEGLLSLGRVFNSHGPCGSCVCIGSCGGLSGEKR